MIDQPSAVICQETMIYSQVFVERRSYSRHYSSPVDRHVSGSFPLRSSNESRECRTRRTGPGSTCYFVCVPTSLKPDRVTGSLRLEPKRELSANRVANGIAASGIRRQSLLKTRPPNEDEP